MNYWSDWCEMKKEANQLDIGQDDNVTLPFDHTHDLDLKVKRSQFKNSLTQEWVGWFTRNEMDASHSFMIMPVTLRWP